VSSEVETEEVDEIVIRNGWGDPVGAIVTPESPPPNKWLHHVQTYAGHMSDAAFWVESNPNWDGYPADGQDHIARVTLEWWTESPPTHGTVEEEMAQNGYFQCACGKMHGKWLGKVCERCGTDFPREFQHEVCR
jgi:hypothetical protein